MRHRKLTTAVAVAVSLTLAALLPAAAPAANNRDRDLSVMTQNLYLGSSLTPAITAPDQPSFIAAVARIYATVQFTNFPARAKAIAAEIDARDPDLIGLQEVSKWTTAGANAPAGYDFLAILQSELRARGLHYEVAAVSQNANIGPIPLISPASGCLTAAPVPDCVVSLLDRDVILVNEDTPALHWSDPKSGRYTAQALIPSPVGTLSFDRGWASIDVKYRGRSITFADTHLETEDFPPVQEAQAAEFISGPASGPNVVAVGDFNSAADGSTTSSYAQLTGAGGFTDAWDVSALGTGNSCCQNETLTNPVPSLTSRIDLVLTKGRVTPTGDAALVGATPFEATPPLYPSDHAGVVAGVTLQR